MIGYILEYLDTLSQITVKCKTEVNRYLIFFINIAKLFLIVCQIYISLYFEER